MSTAELISSETPSQADPSTSLRWGPAHYLALLAVPLLGYQVWTMSAWLAAGPHQVVSYREVGGASWYSAWIIQIVVSVIFAGVGLKIVRGCRRERRLTFDAMLYIGLLLTVFWDTVVNFVQPLWFYSSTWVNLNEWWGNAPFVISPAAGSSPFPVWALTMLYPCFVLECWITSAILRRAQHRFPRISRARLVAIALCVAAVIGAALSNAMILPHLWAGPGMGASILGGSYRWSFAEFFYIAFWSTTLNSMRFFVDQNGRRLTERGVEHLPRRRRTVIKLLATIAFCNLSVIVWSVPVMLTGFYAKPYPNYPRHLSSVVCDTPGLTGSTYGPCPGTPGFRIPLRHH